MRGLQLQATLPVSEVLVPRPWPATGLHCETPMLQKPSMPMMTLTTSSTWLGSWGDVPKTRKRQTRLTAGRRGLLGCPWRCTLAEQLRTGGSKGPTHGFLMA